MRGGGGGRAFGRRECCVLEMLLRQSLPVCLPAHPHPRLTHQDQAHNQQAGELGQAGEAQRQHDGGGGARQRQRSNKGSRHDAWELQVVVARHVEPVVEQVVRGLQVEALLHLGVGRQPGVRRDHRRQQQRPACNGGVGRRAAVRRRPWTRSTAQGRSCFWNSSALHQGNCSTFAGPVCAAPNAGDLRRAPRCRLTVDEERILTCHARIACTRALPAASAKSSQLPSLTQAV